MTMEQSPTIATRSLNTGRLSNTLQNVRDKVKTTFTRVMGWLGDEKLAKVSSGGLYAQAETQISKIRADLTKSSPKAQENKRRILLRVLDKALILALFFLLLYFICSRDQSQHPTPTSKWVKLGYISYSQPSASSNVVTGLESSSDGLVKEETAICAETFGPAGFRDSVNVCNQAFTCLQNNANTAVTCKIKSLHVNTNLINVAAGGEPVDDVKGRSEEAEFCDYTTGAFEVPECTESIISTINKMAPEQPEESQPKDGESIGANIAQSQPTLAQLALPNHLFSFVNAVKAITPVSECSETVKTPTLFITRYEYANLYHTMTDLFNTYQTIRLYDLENVNIIFLDGHSQSVVDDLWSNLFKTDPKYISSIQPSTCFKDAYLVSPGYRSALSYWTMKSAAHCRSSPYVKDFAKFVLERHELSKSSSSIAFSDPITKILLVLRVPYQSHPRMERHRVARQLGNKLAVTQMLQSLPGVQVEIVSFENMSIKEQIEAVQSADIIVGVHGAGLSHVLFARPNTALVEIRPLKMDETEHFEYFSLLRGDILHVAIPGSPDSPFRGVHVNVETLQSVVEDVLKSNKSLPIPPEESKSLRASPATVEN